MGSAMNVTDLPLHLTMHGPPVPPKLAARRLSESTIRGGFTPEALHEYADAGGTPLYWRVRARLASGEKWIRPMRVCGMVYELKEPEFINGKKPLYGLDELARADPAAPVWFVEGEAKVDALRKLGIVATTAGGATSDAGTDFEPLRGRRAILWPDNDEPGKAHMLRIAAILRGIGCAVEMLAADAIGLSERGDVVDWLALHPNGTADDLMALPRIAQPQLQTTAMNARLAGSNPIRSSASLVRAADVQCEPIDWLWIHWLAAGKIHILAGAAGTGKTTLALSLAAIVSSGGWWPDGTRCKPGDVVIWSGEDDASDVLVPRLHAMGANVDRVHFISGVNEASGKRPFDPANDIESLRSAWPAGARLLIVDPIVSAVAADSHNNGDVRRGLQPLVDLAAEHGCAVLGITHFTKGTNGREPLERVTGSLAFGAVARIVLVAAKMPDKNERLLAIAKSNIGPDQGGFNYRLQQVQVPKDRKVSQPIWASRVDWGAPLNGSARELLAATETQPGDETESPRVTDAFLRECLSVGPVSAKQIRADANGAGYSWDRVQRSARRLNVDRRKEGMRGGWVWVLPEGGSNTSSNAEGSEDGTQNHVPPSHSSGGLPADQETF